MNKNWIKRREGRTRQHGMPKSISIKGRQRKSSGCVPTEGGLTPGGLPVVAGESGSCSRPATRCAARRMRTAAEVSSGHSRPDNWLKVQTIVRGKTDLEPMSNNQRQNTSQEAFPSSGQVKPGGHEGMADLLIAGELSESPMFGLHRTFNTIEPPWYGPVCQVVWEGGTVRFLPIPISPKFIVPNTLVETTHFSGRL